MSADQAPSCAGTSANGATPEIDVPGNRRTRKWTPRELLGRAIWEVLRGPLFAWTPRPFWRWRRVVLRLFGARVGRNVHVYPTVRIAVPWNLELEDDVSVGDHAILYSLGPISIGRASSVSQNAHLCAGTHDHRRRDLPLLKKPIRIGAGVWICADAFIGPGISVGQLSIVGARAVVVKDVGPGLIVGGNPARVIKRRPPFDDPGN